MQNLSDLRRWLSNEISEVPLMLHGTGIEAIFEAANNGKLPTGIIDIGEDYVNNSVDGRLFFMPVTSRLGKAYEKLKSEGLADVDGKSCFIEAKNYAELNAFSSYVASELGCKKAEMYSTIRDWAGRDISLRELQKALKKYGLNLTLQQIIEIDSNAKKRKGVIIDFKESTLDLPLHVSDDDEEAIYIECSEGLDKIHINGIELLGPVEKRLMKRFLEGKLEYNGFKTEKPEHHHKIKYFEV